MKKIICFLLFSFVSISIFCEEIRVGILNGPSCVPSAYLIENVHKIDEADLSFEKFSDAQSLLPKLLKNEIDIGFLPPNVAAKIYNSANKAVICCAVTGNGNLSLITHNPKATRFSDLKGKTVTVAGQGATPEYMFKYLLKQNGIEINSNSGVNLDFSIPTAQIASQIISGKISYAIVPEPFATIAVMKSNSVYATIDLQDEYEFFTGKNSYYPMTLMVVRKTFAEKNPQLLDTFLHEYEKSLKWTCENSRLAGQLCEKNELGLTMSVVSKAIPKSNYVYIPAIQAKSNVESLLNLFLENEKNSIGGTLPDNDFYYVSQNSKDNQTDKNE